MSKLILSIHRNFYKNYFFKYLVLFVLINILLFLFIIKFNNKVKLNLRFYNAAVHFYEDPRINSKNFDFFKSTSVYDAQWYLEIAKSGYPKINSNFKLIDFRKNEPHKYAFFPLYPFLLYLVNIPVNNLELTAFFLSMIFTLINFCLLYFFISLIDTKKTSVKTALLLFTFPLSIFYRSFFSEGLFLFLLLLFVIFLYKKKFYLSGVFLGLSLVTRANSLPLVLLIFFDFYKNYKKVLIKSKIIGLIGLIFTIFLPLFIWMLVNYYLTGNFFTFLMVRNFSFLDPLLNNLYRIVEFPFLPSHAFADSKIEVLSVFTLLYFLLKSKRTLDYRLWWIMFSSWLFPLLTTPLISYSRYQIVSFPIFYYLARQLKNWRYSIVFSSFLIGLFFLSLYFVNWYWFG